MDSKLIITSIISILCCCSPPKEGDQEGYLVLTCDLKSVIHSDSFLPIDKEEKLSFCPNGSEESLNALFLLPDEHVLWAISPNVSLPPDWLGLRDTIRIWFNRIPYVESEQNNKVQKILPITYFAVKLDSSLVGRERYRMLQSDYSNNLHVEQQELFVILRINRRL